MSALRRRARWTAPLLAALVLAGSTAAVQAATPKAGEWSGSYDGPQGLYFTVGGKGPSITEFTVSTVSCIIQVKKPIPVKDSGRFVYSGGARAGTLGISVKIEGKFTSKQAGWVKIPRVSQGGEHSCPATAPKIDIAPN